MAQSKIRKTSRPVPRRRMCGAMEAHMRLLETDPGMRERRAEIHALTSRLIAEGASSRRMRSAPVTIPVVVHVVYKNAAENIGVSQITSQIDALNRDFGASNPDRITCPSVWTGLIDDAQIRFALATKNPEGKNTTGITRTATDVTSTSW